LLTPSRVKWAGSAKKMLRIIWGLELTQRHNSNRLHMSLGSRCCMRWIWYGCTASACNVHQTLRVEVSTSGLNSRANFESEMSHCIRTHWSDLQRLMSVGPLKCSGCALGGRTHVARPGVLQISQQSFRSDNCAASSNCKHVIFL